MRATRFRSKCCCWFWESGRSLPSSGGGSYGSQANSAPRRRSWLRVFRSSSGREWGWQAKESRTYSAGRTRLVIDVHSVYTWYQQGGWDASSQPYFPGGGGSGGDAVARTDYSTISQRQAGENREPNLDGPAHRLWPAGPARCLGEQQRHAARTAQSARGAAVSDRAGSGGAQKEGARALRRW